MIPEWAMVKVILLSGGTSSGVFAAGIAFNFSDLVLVLAALIAGFATWRAGTGNIWRSNYEGMKAERDELRAQLIECRGKLHVAEQRPEISALVQELRDQHKREREMWGDVVEQMKALTAVLGRGSE